MVEAERKNIVPSFADLIDRLTILQLKEVFYREDRASFAAAMTRIEHDLGAIIKAQQIKFTAPAIRLVVALAQMNLHIWHCRDKMREGGPDFDEQMKLSHQLNGIRNQLKNRLLEAAGSNQVTAIRTNTDREDLLGWDLGILK